MMSQSSTPMVGQVEVFATQNRGYSPEEITDMTLNKILYIGKDIDPVIQQQAVEYRDQIRSVLINAIKTAQRSERTTLYNLCKQQGHEDMAEVIRKL